MKPILTAVLTAMFFVAGVSLVYAGIGSTAHDFSGAVWNKTGQLCVVCHTPHNADASVTSAPLWSHALTNATYQLYSSSTLQAAMGQPGGISKLCLSCHDGTVALDSFGGTSGTTYISGGSNMGSDFSNDHPTSFPYDSALVLADGDLKDPSTIGLPLFAGKVECATCHDAHDSVNAPFLRMSNAGSALCFKCHIK